jgi:hypothetical protein
VILSIAIEYGFSTVVLEQSLRGHGGWLWCRRQYMDPEMHFAHRFSLKRFCRLAVSQDGQSGLLLPWEALKVDSFSKVFILLLTQSCIFQCDLTSEHRITSRSPNKIGFNMSRQLCRDLQEESTVTPIRGFGEGSVLVRSGCPTTNGTR